MSKEVRVVNGLGLGSIVFCIFLVLKLVGTIDWSWWWVTAPLWGPVAILLTGEMFIFLILALAAFGLKIIDSIDSIINGEKG